MKAAIVVGEVPTTCDPAVSESSNRTDASRLIQSESGSHIVHKKLKFAEVDTENFLVARANESLSKVPDSKSANAHNENFRISPQIKYHQFKIKLLCSVCESYSSGWATA